VASEFNSHQSDAKDERQTKTKTKTKKDASESDDEPSEAEHFGRTVTKKTMTTKKSQKDALFRVRWWRIVLGKTSSLVFGSCANNFLDEAHNIKNRNTKAALACCALEGKYRWCLTGTPLYVVVNAVMGFEILMTTFLNRQNNVEELYSLLKFLRIRPLNDWQTFNEQINQPVKSGKSVRAMKRLHVSLDISFAGLTATHVYTGCLTRHHVT